MKRLTDDELDKIVNALDTLRRAAAGYYRLQSPVRDAINTLDNADVFEELDGLADGLLYRERTR